MAIEAEAVVRQRNQITLPSEIVGELGIHEGDRILIIIGQEGKQATLHPIRQSYRGALKGVYGASAEEAQAYIDGERSAWE